MATAQDNPEAFVGHVTLSAYEPYPMVTQTNFSSFAAGSFAAIPWVQPGPVGFNKVVVLQTMAAGVPTATGQASTGSQGFSYQYNAALFKRQDYSANSTNLSCIATGSFGLSASLGYSSTSQVYGMSWVTDSTGGQSNFTTTSGDAGWSNFASGQKFVTIPMSGNLSAGEYCMMFMQSSTSGTSNSNVTLLSFSQLQLSPSLQSFGAFGGSVTLASHPPGMPLGVVNSTASASVTLGATMPMTAVSYSGRNIYFNLRAV